jgi:hypothetical protein
MRSKVHHSMSSDHSEPGAKPLGDSPLPDREAFVRRLDQVPATGTQYSDEVRDLIRDACRLDPGAADVIRQGGLDTILAGFKILFDCPSAPNIPPEGHPVATPQTDCAQPASPSAGTNGAEITAGLGTPTVPVVAPLPQDQASFLERLWAADPALVDENAVLGLASEAFCLNLASYEQVSACGRAGLPQDILFALRRLLPRPTSTAASASESAPAAEPLSPRDQFVADLAAIDPDTTDASLIQGLAKRALDFDGAATGIMAVADGSLRSIVLGLQRLFQCRDFAPASPPTSVTTKGGSAGETTEEAPAQ